MRIAYLTFEKPGSGGVGRKLTLQRRFWEREGHVVRHIVLRAHDCAEEGGVHFPIRKTILSPLFTASLNAGRIREELKQFAPDVVYMRQMLRWPGLHRILKGYPVVEEVNSDINGELRSSGRVGLVKFALHRCGQIFMQGIVSGEVFVTRELKARYGTWHTPSCVISNGAIFPKSLPDKIPVRDAPSLIMVCSSDQDWHGIDILFDICRNLPEYKFHIVGPFKDCGANNILFHGVMNDADLRQLYKKMDFGVAVLALGRKKMTEACPLKVREYVENGLPVIGGYDDTDLGSAPYFLKIDPESDDVIAEIRRFVDRWRGKAFPFSDAEKRLSFACKERSRLAFLQKVSTVA
ncbi:glycosyltransferase involved in cell wall biosynthesis [Pseudaminobacter salicylatoxidans]|uniref:Glycosyltransferase involved in cell wall biosynthesis n=1 Tax=Pseudaminobacter salicylatoxidans TaxID=93369 RepID=A0A316C0T7_PSESE|nr:glycosyltransferase [Pseudaminobacter salicylatoxidans]PWJ81620.1 glycosyltransferase involved in cell wall biosynthesis [Pseudaminobacter salicylatoxidans]